jgi:hypothetical protein
MYAYRQLKGLQPQATYQIAVSPHITSNAPENSREIGRSPGSSAYIKAGAATESLSRSLDGQDYCRMDMDNGNRSSGRSDMLVLDHLGTPPEDPVCTNLTGSDTPFAGRMNATGALWIVVGSDSGFEGTTTVDCDRITVELR